jgi:hypothetical protein
VTAISDTEEEALGRAALVPFLVEDKLREVRMHACMKAAFQPQLGYERLER